MDNLFRTTIKGESEIYRAKASSFLSDIHFLSEFDDSHLGLPINTPNLLHFCTPPATDPWPRLRPVPPGTKESLCISGLPLSD